MTSLWINKLPTRQRCILAQFESRNGKSLSKKDLRLMLIKEPQRIVDLPWCGRKTMCELFDLCGLPDRQDVRKKWTTNESINRRIAKAITLLEKNGYEIRQN